MKLPLESFVGTGWDQVLAMLTVGGMITAAVLLVLRWRFAGFFVTHGDFVSLRESNTRENNALSDRLRKVEVQVTDSASSREVNTIAERVRLVEEGLSRQGSDIADVKVALSGAVAEIRGVGEGVKRVEHMMGLLVQHHLDKAK
jgi:hypothetical protein